MKALRQAAILDIVDNDPVVSQELLRVKLRQRGVDATQATLSRDLKELGLVKRASDGAYQRPDAPARALGGGESSLRRAVTDYLRNVDRVRELVVVKTGIGEAQMLALAIDGAGVPEVVGTIAGDDTVLVVVRDERRAVDLATRLERWAGR